MFTVLLWYVHAVMVHRSRLIRNLAQTPISEPPALKGRCLLFLATPTWRNKDATSVRWDWAVRLQSSE